MSNKKIPRKVHDVLDFDYLDTLGPEEVAFMIKFIAEYYYGNVQKPYVHKSVKQRRELSRANDARRRDVWNRMDRVWFGDECEWGDDSDF